MTVCLMHFIVTSAAVCVTPFMQMLLYLLFAFGFVSTLLT